MTDVECLLCHTVIMADQEAILGNDNGKATAVHLSCFEELEPPF